MSKATTNIPTNGWTSKFQKRRTTRQIDEMVAELQEKQRNIVAGRTNNIEGTVNLEEKQNNEKERPKRDDGGATPADSMMEDAAPKQYVEDKEDRAPDGRIEDAGKWDNTVATEVASSSSKQPYSLPAEDYITKQHVTPTQTPLHQGTLGAVAGKTMSSQQTGPFPMPMPMPHHVNLGTEEPSSRNLNLYENRLISTSAPQLRTQNRFEHLSRIEHVEQWIPQHTNYLFQREMQAETVRKQREWELTKKRLEDKMRQDREKLRQENNLSGSEGKTGTPPPPPPPPPPPRAKSWAQEEEKNQNSGDKGETAQALGINTIQDIEVQSPTLDTEKIHWDEENEIFFHASGMCYDPDPGVKAYYTLIDPQDGDLRPLYYVQSGGDFSLARNGKLGQCNKIILGDKTWDQKAIYNVKSLKYKQGLLKMFKDRIKEGRLS